MKKIFVIAILFLGTKSGISQAAADFTKLAWLEGTWKRTGTKPGQSGVEIWSRSGDEWKGSGIAMKGNDTAFVEKLKIVTKNNHIYYVADVSDNKEPVYFTFTTISESGFECENPEHDFPKKIAYQKDGNKLRATISGNGKTIDYWFEKN